MSDSPLDSSGVPEEFWYNLKTGHVEFGKLSPASYRVGPFSTREEAEHALETLKKRTQKWEAEEED